MTARPPTHMFELDPVGHAGHRGEQPCRFCPCRQCPLVYGNTVHELPVVPEQAEHRRRYGDKP